MTTSSCLRIGVVGPRQSGKTSLLLWLAERLATASLRVGGVVQPAVRDGERIQGYDLLDLHSGAQETFATRRRAGPGYRFESTGWAWARERIEAARVRDDVLVVDELGRLEARGGGHLPAVLSPLSEETARCRLFGIREDRFTTIRGQLGPLQEVLVAPGSERKRMAAHRLILDFFGSP